MSINNEAPTNQIILVCMGVIYYGLTDEEIFFDALRRIQCIQDIDGSGRELYLHIPSTPISDDDLRYLLGLFYRYRIDMKQLKIFLTDSNKAWFFEDTSTFWHDKVFC